MLSFLLLSLIASVVLTILANVGLWVWRKRGGEIARRAEEAFGETPARAQIIFPWRTMLIVSIGLTILVNALLFIL